MEKKNEPKEGKNGLRNYSFERVKKGKIVYLNDPRMPGAYQEWTNFFYTKKCLYCSKEFEAKRVDTTFCSQNCQKAHLRLRRK
ncbi:hypothetical protein CWM47_29160 [Spirosoma pollinicola]|uniref:Uncharacterized protein n=1 Tax=Spirosoma pollinicola TaxID=2057025 RepID=A0A2K8Z6N9_9BACT|nr:hypothetical protein CWM47_29160 [Spirosoma pollinicola]